MRRSATRGHTAPLAAERETETGLALNPLALCNATFAHSATLSVAEVQGRSRKSASSLRAQIATTKGR
jgi:hypothetical protein